MQSASFSREKRRAAKGSALVIVLFFVILLTVVTIAFLSRSLTAVKVAASSAGETKASLLASSASDIIIGDLKQEIVAGSASVGTANFPVYTPNSNLTMIPFQNGVPAGNAIPNMISRSVSPLNTSGTAPAVSYPVSTTQYSSLTPTNRAASDSTAASETISATYPYTTTKVSSSYPSLNGRYVSPAQWNSHYLIPRNTTVDTAGSTSTDSTPATSFVPPDWVIVTRAGASSVPWSTGTGGLNDPTLTNTNYAIGRYAYAIYNEGGLLDMNVAGYPAGLTAAQMSEKGSLALADLTQLAVGGTNLTQTQVNNFVGWRNYASAEYNPTTGASTSPGSYNSFTFPTGTPGNWLTNFVMTPMITSGQTSYFMGNTNGFMQITPPPSAVTTPAPPTDQALLSRQQLISVTQSLGMSPDFLQYMGTFSRALQQPSYVPNSNRPVIVGTALPPAPPASYSTAFTTYQGNNTYWGSADAGGIAINMKTTGGFLGVRVITAFTRLDGTTAVIGEPLVKRKFALSRLALVTTNYAPTFSSAAAAATDPVYQRFGIYRTSTTTPWIYNHGINDSNGVPIIGTLASVAGLHGSGITAAREPDFAELLKAAINVGSVGKAGPSGQGINNQYVADTSGDVQILQIMANLIDQQKTDNYPIWIQYGQDTSTGTITRNIYGDADLPYFYRWNYYNFTKVLPSPILASTDTVTVTIPGTPPTTDGPIYHSKAGSYTIQGLACSMMVPEVWNPHDPNMPVASGGGPTAFRIVAITNLPSYAPGYIAYTNAGSPGTSWTVNAIPCGVTQFDGGGNGEANCPSTLIPAAAPMTYTPGSTPSTYIQFTDNSGGIGIPGKAFREPTILWRSGYPSGVTLSGPGTETEALTGNKYYGLMIADNVPISWNWTGQDGSSYFSQASTMWANNVAGASGSNYQNTDFLMQYQDASGTWITYQETYLESQLRDFPSYTLFVNQNEPAYLSSGADPYAWQNPFAVGVSGGGVGNATAAPFDRPQSGIYDPRTNRFTAACCGAWPSDDTLDANTTVSTATNPTVATSNFVLLATTRPTTALGQSWPYTTPCRQFDSGDAGLGQNAHWYSSPHGTTTSGAAAGNWTKQTDANFFDGLLSQNNPALDLPTGDNSSSMLMHFYYEDPDGVARRAMGGYVPVSGQATAGETNMTNQNVSIGLPTVSSGGTLMANYANGIVTPTSQSQSRPILLHRPFRSVAEMSYAFRGTPWKNIDFFTPESGDTALLDVFCVNEPPSTAMIAGKVDLNTRQAPVLQALFSSAYRDEFANVATPPSGTLPPLSSTEAGNLATTLVGITTSKNAWEGPLANVADIVGHFVYPDPGSLSGTTDVYQYTSPANNTEYTYSGFSAALSAATGIWDAGNLTSSQDIQRFRESAIRPLADCGQTRVWNLLIDVVAQTGHYPKTATGLDQFYVDGQKHAWVHVAIDRYTGQVIDKQVEVVTP